jgi:hypothetical protein
LQEVNRRLRLEVFALRRAVRAAGGELPATEKTLIGVSAASLGLEEVVPLLDAAPPGAEGAAPESGGEGAAEGEAGAEEAAGVVAAEATPAAAVGAGAGDAAPAGQADAAAEAEAATAGGEAAPLTCVSLRVLHAPRCVASFALTMLRAFLHLQAQAHAAQRRGCCAESSATGR